MEFNDALVEFVSKYNDFKNNGSRRDDLYEMMRAFSALEGKRVLVRPSFCVDEILS